MHKTFSRQLALAAIALFSISLSACGGGGGGSSTPPVSSPTGPGNGGSPPPSGNPTATPSPGKTATPGPTPTPIQTATPSQTPTPMPTTGTASTIIADTTGRFGLIQILDSYGGSTMTTSQIQSEAPHYDSIWGAFFPQAWDASHPGMIVSRYMIPNEDENLISGHDLAWFKANHPDWVMYACDSNGNPTNSQPYADTGFADVPLDIHNPQVVSYLVHLMGNYMAANGYNTLAVDNVTFVNYMWGPNPELGQGSPQKGWYSCGVYQNGTFVRRYGSAGSSDFNQPDPAWIADLVGFLQQAQQIFATDYASNHFHIIINHPINSNMPTSTEQTMLNYIDGMVTENGYTDYGQLFTGSTFLSRINWIEYLQAHHKAAFVTDYYCTGSRCSNDPNSLTPQQMDWSLATYALGNEGGEDLYASPHGGSIYSYRSEYATTYGSACGSYTQVSSSVYERKFQGALVIVNASGSPYSLSLPSGHSYHDIEGRAVNNPLTVNGPDAYFLLTSNGCS